MTRGARVARASGTAWGTIVVLGSCSVDLVVRQPRLPRPGETIFGEHFSTVPGGKGLNQAVAAARAGGAVRFLGLVGRDGYGEQVRDCLAESGVDLEGLEVVDGATGTAHISVLEGGENAIVFVPAANGARSSLDERSRQVISTAAFLVTQFERPMPLIVEALTSARAMGVRTVVTPAPVVAVGAEFLELVDILVPNSTEARELAGMDDDVEAAMALSRRAGMVILTRGERGALVAEGGRITAEVAARRVVPLDTTAAGDTFVGALVAWLASGSTLQESLTAAAAAASIAVTRHGASASVPHRSEIDAVLAPTRS